MEVGGLKAKESKTLIINRCGETKNAFFGLQTRGLREGEEEKEEEEEGGGASKGMEIMDFIMILVQELLGYGLLRFQLDINLVPFSRVLLGKHSNSKFKLSLVEKP